MATDLENRSPIQDVAELDKRNEEIAALREILSSMTSGEGDLRDAKLIELFKKNKMLNVQLERERTRTRTMRKTVTFIQEELRRREQVEVQEDKLVKMGVYYWVDKYQRTSTKLMEAQSKIGAMDTKIHKLMFALRREVGNHMPIDKVLEEGSGWVGRSEQISLLKHKVEELKSLCKDMMPTSKPVRHTTLHHDDRRTVEILHRNQIEKVDHDRRVQYDNLVHDFVLIASNARRSVLEKQIFKAKNTVAVLLSKSKNDDLLINALSIELGGMRQAADPPYSNHGGPTHLEYVANHNKLAAQYHKLYTQCHEQEREINVQGEIIQTFQDALEPDDVTDWVTTSFVRSSYKSEPRMILHDDSYDEKSPDYEKTLEAETKEADVY
ncbi:uncharacterized protein [Physcomitrium patens]|uniref:uncharacterized protein isoform X2 n=1 Tax=Physcomitrium patens TaxID=3218 RepID=UPI003CCCBBB7